MRDSRLHPIYMIREKYPPSHVLETDKDWLRILEHHEISFKKFQHYCSTIVEELKNMSLHDNDDIKEASYLMSKLRKESRNINLRESNSTNPRFKEIREGYFSLQKKFIEEYDKVKNNFEANRLWGRKNLADYLKEELILQSMFYLLSPFAYNRMLAFINGEYKEKKAKEIDKVLLRLVTKATTKTSPLWRYNKVSFKSHDKEFFDYKVNKKQITPNFVFCHRIFETMLLHEDNIEDCSFIITKKFSKDESFYYIFRNINDNYKIYRAKDNLVKVKANSLFSTIFSLGNKEVNSKDIYELINCEKVKGNQIIRQLHEYGILIMKYELKEDFNILENLLQWVYSLKNTDFNHKMALMIKRIIADFKKINDEPILNIETLESIYEGYGEIIEYLDMDAMDKKIMIYSDFLEPYSKDSESAKPSSQIYGLLKCFPAFDINQIIQHELVDELNKRFNSMEISLDHPNMIQILTDINLKFGSYWTSPWDEMRVNSENGKFLQGLKLDFINKISMTNENNELNIESEIEGITHSISERGLDKEGYYTLFYQKENDKTVINKVYPGFGAFYQRFLRFTDILDKNPEYRDFYKTKNQKFAEIFETLGFNANVVEEPYLESRYKDLETRGKWYDDLFKKVYKSEGATIKVIDNDMLLEYPSGERIRPVIASSLIRAFYPGRIAFLSSLFSNISFIIDMTSQVINSREGNIICSPRIVYKDIVLERKCILIKQEAFESFFVLNEIDFYLKIRSLIGDHIGTKFFYHKKKSDSKLPIKSIANEFDKPQYCDLDSVINFDLLVSAMKDKKDILFYEIHPLNPSAPEYAQELKVYG